MERAAAQKIVTDYLKTVSDIVSKRQNLIDKYTRIARNAGKEDHALEFMLEDSKIEVDTLTGAVELIKPLLNEAFGEAADEPGEKVTAAAAEETNTAQTADATDKKD